MNTKEMLQIGLDRKNGHSLGLSEYAMSDYDVDLDYSDEVSDVKVASFRCGDNQIDFGTHKLKSGWESYDHSYYGKMPLDDDERPLSFQDGIEIRENGKLLYRDASGLVYVSSDGVDNIKGHYEIFTDGEFETKEAALSYLEEKYPDAQWKETDTQAKRLPTYTYMNWQNPEWKAHMDDLYDTYSKDTTRLAVRDLGEFVDEDGRPVHKVVYEYACDQKTIGKDNPMINPELQSTPYVIPTYEYNDMMNLVNARGCDGTDYEGVLQAVVKPRKFGGMDVCAYGVYDKMNALISKVPLDVEKHKAFIEASRQMAKQLTGSLTRIAVKDHGMQKNQGGKLYHKVDFAYACDQMQVGVDKPVVNPYLSTTKMRLPGGGTRTSHSMYLSPEVYYRMHDVLNTDGCDGKDWDGVFLSETKIYKGKVTPDLTKVAEVAGRIQKPDMPFDAEKHEAFVKASQDVVGKQRVAALESRLPSFDNAEVSMDRGLGE